MKVRCPHCRSDVNAPRDVIAEHKRAKFYGVNVRCEGSGLDALPVAIADAERVIADKRARIDAYYKRIARLESDVREECESLAADEIELAALCKKLAAKGGSR